MKSERHVKTAIWRDVSIRVIEDIDQLDLFEEYANLLQKSTGIAYEILDQVDLGTSKKLPNGSWTGMIGMIQRGEADIALGPLFISEERMEVVDFTYPFWIDKFMFATKYPKYSPGTFAVLYPFEVSVWITLLLSFIVITSASFMIFNTKLSLVTLLFQHFAAIIGHGPHIKWQKLSCRLQYYSWMLGMVFLANCYKSVLLAFLTFPALKGVTDFKELAEAVQMGKYQCVVPNQSFIPIMMMHSDINDLRIIGENIHNSPIGYNDEEELFKPSRLNIALVEVGSRLTSLSRKFFVSNDFIYPVMIGHAVNKTYCCKKGLDKAVVKIMESGLLLKMVDDFYFRMFLHQLSSESNEEPFRVLSLYEVTGVFIILICGYLISVCVLAFEILYIKCKKIP